MYIFIREERKNLLSYYSSVQSLFSQFYLNSSRQESENIEDGSNREGRCSFVCTE